MGTEKRGRHSGTSKQGSGGAKNKRKQVQLYSDKSLSTGNPAVDNVDEGKHRGLSHFKQNSRRPGWTSKQKKNKQNSVTNVNPMNICFFWTPDVPHQVELRVKHILKDKDCENLKVQHTRNVEIFYYSLSVLNVHSNMSDRVTKPWQRGKEG